MENLDAHQMELQSIVSMGKVMEVFRARVETSQKNLGTVEEVRIWGLSLLLVRRLVMLVGFVLREVRFDYSNVTLLLLQVLKEWMSVTKAWASLESIFLASVDIRAQLPGAFASLWTHHSTSPLHLSFSRTGLQMTRSALRALTRRLRS
jgi:dynein heavy chain, axonemal